MVKSITSSSVLLWSHRLGSAPGIPNKHSVLGFRRVSFSLLSIQCRVLCDAWWTLTSFCRNFELETSTLVTHMHRARGVC